MNTHKCVHAFRGHDWRITLGIGERITLINREMHRLKIVYTVAHCPTRLLVFKDMINFLSVFDIFLFFTLYQYGY